MLHFQTAFPVKLNSLSRAFLDGRRSKTQDFHLKKWRPIVRELRSWNVYTSFGDIKSVGKNHPDAVAIPLEETSICKGHPYEGDTHASCLCAMQHGKRNSFHVQCHQTCTWTHIHMHPDTLWVLKSWLVLLSIYVTPSLLVNALGMLNSN